MHRRDVSPPATPRRKHVKWTDGVRPPEAIFACLTSAGIRPTPVRCDVLGVLLADTEDMPPRTAEAVYRDVAHAGMSFPNIYRILGELVKAGLVDRMHPEGGKASVFAIRRTSPSGHLACVICHVAEPVIDPWMVAQAEALCRERGLTVQSLSWRMTGQCRRCAGAPRGNRPRGVERGAP